MGAFNSAVITKKGHALLAKVLQSGTKLEFTQVKTSEDVLMGDLTNRTHIGTVKQSEKVASVVKQGEYSVKVSTSFSNADRTSGYYIRNIGLYAKDPTEGEILYSISVADESIATADWMPPFNGVSVSSLMVDLITVVSNASSVNVTVDPTAFATVAQIIEVHEHLTALENSIPTTTEKILRGSVAGGLKINKVFGKSEQINTIGKNLIPSISASNTVNGVSFRLNEDGTILVNGTATAYASVSGEIVNAKDLAGKTIAFLGAGKGSNVVTQIKCSDEAGNTWMNMTASDKEYATYTLGASVAKLQFEVYVANGNTASNVVVYPYLVEHENKPISKEDYEPYTGGTSSPNPEYPQEIKSVEVSKITAYKKNRLKNVAVSKVTNGISFTVSEDGSVKASGTATSSAVLHLNEHSLEQLQVGEYIPSGVTGVRITHRNGTIYYLNKPFTVDDTVVAIAPYLSIEAGTTVNSLIFQPMIRNASIEDDTYEPYVENSITLSQPITLNGIGEVMDELTPAGVVRKIAKVVLNGSESWGVFNTDKEGIYRRKTTSLGELIKSTAVVMSDRYPAKTSSETYQRVEGVSVDANQNVIIYDADFTESDSSAWINYLGDNPVTFLYEISSPTVEPLPVADQIALRSLVGYDGITCLGTDSAVDPAIEVDYGTTKLGAHTLTGLLTAQRNEVKLSELINT
jgi:hypothetical protein